MLTHCLVVPPDASLILFSLDVGTERLVLHVRSPAPLNDHQWHRVDAERNIKEAVLQLDGRHRESRATPPQGHGKVELHGDLYVGRKRSSVGSSRIESQFLPSRMFMLPACNVSNRKACFVHMETLCVY